MKSIRYYSATIVALVLVAAVYLLARPTSVPETELAKLAGRFHFKRTPLAEIPGAPQKFVREVHPSLQRISAWVSTLGAAVTFADMDGDGLPNDLIHVDPRTDLVTVAPAPGTGDRYRPFALDAAPLPYNPKTTAAMGTLAGDFNEDGLTDVLIYYWGRTPVILLQAGRGVPAGPLTRAAFTAVELTTSGERWYSNGATQADLDGDGHVDIVIGNYFQDGAHILDAQAGGVEVMHEGKGKALNGGLKHFFLWQSGSAGTLRPASDAASSEAGRGVPAEPSVQFKKVEGFLPEEVNRGWTLAIACADLDGDLLPEIYFGFDFGPDRLLHNRSKPGQLQFAVLEGRRDFLTPKSCVLNHDSFKGMGADFGDVNGDGLLDIYVSNIATRFGLTESHFLWQSTGDFAAMQRGIAPYIHAAEKLGLARSGWGWDSKLADFDNDGVLEALQAVGFIKGDINRWPELQALGTSNDQVVHNPKFWPNFKPGADLSGHDRNPFFVRGDDGRYRDVGQLIGFDEPMVSRGIATADVDADGLLDFAVANQWNTSFFFKNDSPQPNAFLGLRLLRGHGSPVIGAAASVTLPDGRKLVNHVDGGSGHSGRRSPDIHFGLGRIDKNAQLNVELKWRNAKGKPLQTKVQLAPGWHTLRMETFEMMQAGTPRPASLASAIYNP